jgi:hypothetical protein
MVEFAGGNKSVGSCLSGIHLVGKGRERVLGMGPGADRRHIQMLFATFNSRMLCTPIDKLMILSTFKATFTPSAF